MANCKDNCIHYKVCMYGDLTEYKTEQILKDDCDDFMPKDVVPKSEVERLQDDNKFLQDRRFKEWSEVRQEVAREIFEEMIRDAQRILNFVEAIEFDSEEIRKAKLECYRDCLGYFEKLKKKYTERSEKNSS